MRGSVGLLGAALGLGPIACQGADATPAAKAGEALHPNNALDFAGTAQSPAPGVAWLWGANLAGQIGRTAPNYHVPQPLESLPGVVAVSGGLLHTLALSADGSVWAFGDNEQGQLGWSDALPSRVPRKVPGVSGITAIAAGGFHSLAFSASDGSLWAWGSNSSGQLGIAPGDEPVRVPTRVPIAEPLVAIAAGGDHTLALDASGQLWSWGANNYGQLGDGTIEPSDAPRRVPLPK